MSTLVFFILLVATDIAAKIRLGVKNHAHCLDFMREPPTKIKSYMYDDNPSPKRVRFEFEGIEYSSKNQLNEINLGIALEAEDFYNSAEKTSLPVDVRLVQMKHNSNLNLQIWFDVSSHCGLTNFSLSLRDCNDSKSYVFRLGVILPTLHLSRHITDLYSVELLPKTDMFYIHGMKMFKPLREFSCSSPIEIGLDSIGLLLSTDLNELPEVTEPKVTDTNLLATLTALDYKAIFDACTGFVPLILYIRFVQQENYSTNRDIAYEAIIEATYFHRMTPTLIITLVNSSYILENQGLERLQKCHPVAEIPGKVNLTKQDGKFEISASIYCDNPFDAVEINKTKVFTIGDIQDIELQFDSNKNEIVLSKAGVFVNCRHISLELQCYQEDDSKHSVHQVIFRKQSASAESLLGKFCRITRPKSGYVYIGMKQSELNLAEVVAGVIGCIIGIIIFLSLLVYIIRCRRGNMRKDPKKDSNSLYYNEQVQQSPLQQPSAALQANIEETSAKQEAPDTAKKPLEKLLNKPISLKDYYSTVDLNGKIVRQKTKKGQVK